MNTQEKFAKRLDGRELGSEIKPIEKYQAKGMGLVVVYLLPDSECIHDDVLCFNGAIETTVFWFCGYPLYWYNNTFMDYCTIMKAKPCQHCGVKEYWHSFNKNIEVLYCMNDEYEEYIDFQTSIPNVASFKIYESGKFYGNGLVINIEDLK